MTLRARLSLVILTVVLLPLVGGIAVVAGAVPDAMRSQTIARLDSSRAAVTAVLTERCAHAGSAARSLALAASTGTSPDPADAVREVVDGGQGDYAAVLDPSGSVLAEAGSLPPSALPAALSGSCSLGTGTGDSGAAPVLAENVEVTGRDDVGRAVV
ncbi:MAG: hypothetical protein ACRDYU_12715, partial [Actinomycetes bacterium]